MGGPIIEMLTIDEIIRTLKSLGHPENVAGMARYGIVTKRAFGVTAPHLRELAKKLKKETADRHGLALELWETGIHEARAVAYLIDDPKQVTSGQMTGGPGASTTGRSATARAAISSAGRRSLTKRSSNGPAGTRSSSSAPASF